VSCLSAALLPRVCFFFRRTAIRGAVGDARAGRCEKEKYGDAEKAGSPAFSSVPIIYLLLLRQSQILLLFFLLLCFFPFPCPDFSEQAKSFYTGKHNYIPIL
jgi:hypothetical protein